MNEHVCGILALYDRQFGLHTQRNSQHPCEETCLIESFVTEARLPGSTSS